MHIICRQVSVACVTLAIGTTIAHADKIGTRPYELDWAKRTQDIRSPLVDFEDQRDWTVACQQAAATWDRSREQQIWGTYVGKLIYRGTGNRPVITVMPARPIPLRCPYDCVNIWVYGNNWAWAPDPTTPQVTIRVLLASADGAHEVAVDLGRVRWKEWFLMHRRLTADQIRALGKAPRCMGLQILNGRNTADRVLYFDNLAIYQEPLAPLQFAPRRKRGIDLPAGQTTGTNRGPGRLPFPTRAETILPSNLATDFKVRLEASPAGQRFTFRYTGSDGELIYTYAPRTGMLDDVTARWVGRGEAIQPLVEGGVYFAGGDAGSVKARIIKLIRCQRVGDAVMSTWRYEIENRTATVTYTLRLWQKSLIIDVACPGGEIGEFRIGKVRGAVQPRLVTVPYLTGAEQRPAVLVSGPPERPLFMLPLVDHCRSNASLLWFANHITDDGVVQNGGARYLPKTDGQRNACFERLFLTISPEFEEVLPNIPNPKSPWMHVAGARVWRAHGASDRGKDFATWNKVARYGMKNVLITDHETGWRDGGESFTMRTRAAPGKGGDAGQLDYARKIHALGFRYGIYNNYTDYAPVNEFWNEDYVTRTSDNQWRGAWARCYNVKPARAVELEARLAPIIQKKFHLDTAYCDVHTAVRPWSYCDFDARVPGAGTFAATFYAYGEIMLHQKATWNGPVYSEGNNHWYYCGLTDGNYGQDQLARLAENPWLVDFDLRKLHSKCCNFGMGNPGMFYGRGRPAGSTPAQRAARLDRFLAATLAFGHTGFLVSEGGFENTFRSYFSIQQIHARYAQQDVEAIRYANAAGVLVPTSAAVASGAFRRSRIVTKYADGLEVWVNGHATDTWRTPEAELPPNGWNVRDPVKHRLRAFSCLRDGHRVDYVEAPAYVYANGRGVITRFPKITCDGQLAVLPRGDRTVEVIPVGDCQVLGLALDGDFATAQALDDAGHVSGPAETRWSRQRVFIQPVAKATSYLLTRREPPAKQLHCDRASVIPGDTVRIRGTRDRSVPVPAATPLGKLWWYHADDGWLDFTVVPLADVALHVAGKGSIEVELTPHVAAAVDGTVELGGMRKKVTFQPEKRQQLRFDLPAAGTETVVQLPLQVAAGALELRRTWWLKTEDGIELIARLPNRCDTGQCLRGGHEMPLDAATKAAARWTEFSCGNDRRMCLFAHPPYHGAVGYTYAVFDAIQLPHDRPAAFRCDVGKGDGSDPGDGILFRVVAIDANGTQTTVAERLWSKHAWTHLDADLTRFRGRRVRLKLVTDVGPKDDSTGDWGCWSDLRIESRAPVLQPKLYDHAVQRTRAPGPLDMRPRSRARYRDATHAVLHFQAIGLGHHAPYISHAMINNVPLGELPAASGDEQNNHWADVAVKLPLSAIGSLQEWNQLTLINPNNDSFKVRRFWLELEWENGVRGSSFITMPIVSQPPTWQHAEGKGVPFGQDIGVQIRLPVSRGKG